MLKSSLSFPRNYRLVSKFEYQSTFDNATKVAQKYLLALYKPNQSTHSKLGIIVGKRVANRAVVRNQIKRVIRESFRAHPLKRAGLDIIVIARHQCDTLNKEEIRAGIDKLWQRLVTQYQNASGS